jgi:Domain of unknown function (DUF4249)
MTVIKNIRSLFFGAIAMISFASCSDDFFSQTLEIDPPPYEKKLAAHAFGGTLDSIFKVTLSRNFGILETVKNDSFYFVKNAKIELLEDGQSKLTMNSTLDQYASLPVSAKEITSGFFVPGKTYTLKVEHPDFPTISSTQIMPGEVQVDSIQNKGLVKGAFGDENLVLNAFINDRAGQKDFYAIEVSQSYVNRVPIFDNNGQLIRWDTIGTNQYGVFPDGSDDPNVIVSGQTLLVSDEFFDGKKYKFNFRGYPSYYSNQDTSEFTLMLRAITEELYLYKLSAQKRSNTEDVPFAEPVPLYTNFKNGIGIFGLYHEKRYLIK